MLLCYPHQVWTVPPSPKLPPPRSPGSETLGMRVSYPTAKTLFIFPSRKIPLTKFTSSLMKSIISFSQISNFRVMTECKLHLLVVFVAVSLYLTLGFLYTCVMLTFINRCLLNVVFSMTKALNGQNSPKQNFHSPHFIAIWKTLLPLCLF